MCCLHISNRSDLSAQYLLVAVLLTHPVRDTLSVVSVQYLFLAVLLTHPIRDALSVVSAQYLLVSVLLPHPIRDKLSVVTNHLSQNGGYTGSSFVVGKCMNLAIGSE